jgi:hypothetical protein
LALFLRRMREVIVEVPRLAGVGKSHNDVISYAKFGSGKIQMLGSKIKFSR